MTDTTATGAGQGGMDSDTARASVRMHSDTNNPTSGAGAGVSDSARGNQTKSGVTNTQTGRSTLGKGVTTTRPDQNQPVTSKGDTVSGADSTAGANQ